MSFLNQGFSQSEDCSCKTDLLFLHTKVKKTPSYKRNKAVYNDFYSKAIKKSETINSNYDCYILLNKLLITLNDNHCKAYGIDKGATKEVRDDAAKFDEFKNSALFNIYPKPNLDLDSLKTILNSKPQTDIEGVYAKANYFTIGVFKKGDDYQAIILDTEIDVWRKGEVIYTLVPYGNNYLRLIGGGITSKRLIAQNERIENGLFLTMGFNKDLTKTNFSLSMSPDSTYLRKEISTETTYLKIGSFNSWYPTLSDAEKFYKSLDGTLTKNNLILDLRDNGGGGNRNSGALYEIIKEYLKQKKVYIITNNRTGSNAEQFAFNLSQFENCTTFGNRTNGTVAYELVNANYNLPCENFLVTLTSKKHSKYFGIESVGIEPNVKLNMESDWLDQLETYIEERK